MAHIGLDAAVFLKLNQIIQGVPGTGAEEEKRDQHRSL